MVESLLAFGECASPNGLSPRPLITDMLASLTNFNPETSHETIFCAEMRYRSGIGDRGGTEWPNSLQISVSCSPLAWRSRCSSRCSRTSGYRLPTGDLLNGVLQWLHVFFGITWIGLLYYFNFVQTPTMPTIPAELKPGVSKYIAPKALFYFRWGAAFTVLTGLLLAWSYGELVEALTLQPRPG